MDNLKVDVDALLRSRAPKQYKWIPRALIRALERYICQDRLNQVLSATAGMKDSAFAAGALCDLNVSYETESGTDLLPDAGNTAVTYVSNHPLGGLDGICLIDWVARRHNVEPRFIVNDLLTVVTPLSGVFIGINKHGSQSRLAASEVDAAFADLSRPIIMFPAGLCSRQAKKGVEIRDLKWNKMFVQKSAETGRTVIPLRFIGKNSPKFYRLARRRTRLKLKFNLEMLRLPRELVLAQGSRFGLRIGRPIPAENLSRGHEAAAIADKIRTYVYTL